MALPQDATFGTFQDGGNLVHGDIIVGLRGGLNTRFNFQGDPGLYLPLAGGTMAGAIDMAGFSIIGLPTPSGSSDAATKAYVDALVAGEALSKVDDTNVTISLGGTPLTSLLHAVSMTLGWTGQLSVTRGGTGNSTFTAFSVLCAGTTGTGAFQNVSGVGTLNQVLISQGPGALPQWGSVPGVTPAALTKTDDTNVTLTLGGTPATALLQAASLTLGWTGQLGLTRGGSGASLTASNGGIVYSNATTLAILAGTATAGKILQSGASTTPAWSTPTYPSASGTANKIIISDGTNNIYSTSLWVNTVGTAGKMIRSDGTTNTYSTATFADTYSASTLLYSNGANTVTGLATANSAMLYTNSSGVPAMSASMTNGQIIIGSTGGSPAPATLTAGPGVSIASAANSITISGTGSGIGWTEVTGTSQTMTADSGWVSNNAGLVTLTLPTTAAFGTVISVIGKGAGGWKIAQNAGQNIQVGNASTTVGVGGSLASTNRFDSFDMICTTANTIWTLQGGPQSAGLTIV